MSHIINHNLTKTVFIILLMTCFTGSYSQDTEEITPQASSSLNTQYRDMYSKAETYNEYKVFKASTINAFWRQVQDSLKTNRREITSLHTQIDTLNSRITQLESQLDEVNRALTKSQQVADSISILGILILKPIYNIIVWGIIAGLIAAIVLGFGFVKRSKKMYSKIRKEHDTLVNEFDKFKKRALEKKVKLARELQTERNRVMDLESKLGPSEERYSKN